MKRVGASRGSGLLVLALAMGLAACAKTTGPSEEPTEPTPAVPAALSGLLDAVQARAAEAKESGYVPPENDTDVDGLSDEAEAELGTNPYWPDTDNDRRPDGYEVANGGDPLVAETWVPLLSEVPECSAEGGPPGGGFLAANGISCTQGRLNTTTCTATCTGTCCFGLVSCYWSWDPIAWGLDRLVGNPCPGWHCNCP